MGIDTDHSTTDIDQEFKDKVAIITGAGAGIGEATAKLFARRGASVLAADIDDDGARRVSADINAEGGTAVSFAVDVGEPDKLQAMVGYALSNFGRIDVLHNNAMYSGPGRIADLGLDDWNRAIAVNMTAAYYGSQLVIPHMQQVGGGVIINMASVGALAADQALGAYGATKAALISLTRTIAIEYGKDNIRCNCVAPGSTYTTPLKRLMGDVDSAHASPVPNLEEYRASMLNSNVLGRFADPSEIAEAILFLSSSRAPFITGTTLTIDGGLLAQTGLPQLVDW